VLVIVASRGALRAPTGYFPLWGLEGPLSWGSLAMQAGLRWLSLGVQSAPNPVCDI
jgi:hypothetical protein